MMRVALVLWGAIAGWLLREACGTIRARRRRRLAAKAELRAAIEDAAARARAEASRAEFAEATRAVDDRLNASAIGSLAAYEEHRRPCPCDDCVARRRWEAGRNN